MLKQSNFFFSGNNANSFHQEWVYDEFRQERNPNSLHRVVPLLYGPDEAQTNEIKRKHAKTHSTNVDGDLLTEGVKSEKEFGDFRLHLEFRLPFKPFVAPNSQDRGNREVFTYDCYETQILDSFGIQLEHNLGAGLYKFRATDLNMTSPPLSWQTYDITFTAPTFTDGKKSSNARITVKQTGVTVHDDVKLPKGTGAGGKKPEAAKGVVQLQGHDKPVRFRNI